MTAAILRSQLDGTDLKDLSEFSMIAPCGYPPVSQTSEVRVELGLWSALWFWLVGWDRSIPFSLFEMSVGELVLKLLDQSDRMYNCHAMLVLGVL